jgi:glutathione peroxidase
MNKSIYDFSVKRINGETVNLESYRGKVLLVVNVASKCGLTPQYDALEKIYEQYHEQGFEVLGFPANEFGSQEPGTNAEIQEFCRGNFGVKFPMFEKIVVKGDGIHPLYQFLTETMLEATSPHGTNFEDRLKGHGVTRTKKNEILWNFEKFLIGRDGKVVARFNPDVVPDSPSIIDAIEGAL